MSSLSDRLAAARQGGRADDTAGRHAGEPATPAAGPPAQAPPTETTPVTQRRTMANQQQERLEELKGRVHTELLKQLGPQLYDADMDQNELDQRVRTVLADVLAAQDQPISNSDRLRVTQEISDDILGYGPIEPYLRDPDVSEVMVNGHASVSSSTCAG